MEGRKIDGLNAVGAMGAIGGPGLFDRADLILRTEDGQYFHGRRWTSTTVSGSDLPAEDFQALVDCGEASRLPSPLPIPGKAGAWFIRKNFGEHGALREQLDHAKALLHEQVEDTGRLWVVAEDRIQGLRRDWADRSRDHALQLLREKKPGKAALLAERAWLMTPEVTPGIVAFWVLCLQQSGAQAEAEDVRIVERNSRGEAFDRRVEEELRQLQQNLTRQDHLASVPLRSLRSSSIYQCQMRRLTG